VLQIKIIHLSANPLYAAFLRKPINFDWRFVFWIIKNQDWSLWLALHVRVAEEETPWFNQPSHNLNSCIHFTYFMLRTRETITETWTSFCISSSQNRRESFNIRSWCPLSCLWASPHDSSTHVYAPSTTVYRQTFREHPRNAAFFSTDLVSSYVCIFFWREFWDIRS